MKKVFLILCLLMYFTNVKSQTPYYFYPIEKIYTYNYRIIIKNNSIIIKDSIIPFSENSVLIQMKQNIPINIQIVDMEYDKYNRCLISRSENTITYYYFKPIFIK